MRLPSISHIISLASATARRFPVELTLALIGTIAMMRVVFLEDLNWISDDDTWTYARVIMSCVLVMNSTLALTITRNAQRISNIVYWVTVGVLGAALTWFTFSLGMGESNIQLYTAAALTVHAFVSLSAMWNRSRVGFWEFNKTIFLRLLAGGLFTGVLIGGLCLAIVSLRELFDMRVDGWMFGWVVAFFIGMFNTVFVLSGIPETETSAPYPRGLRMFTQFVLMPLVLVFVVILYAYGIKVLFFADLNGSVSTYILLLAIVGILAYLLVYPLRTNPEYAWIAFYARWFGRIMLPLSVMLWVAIVVRTQAYGITEERYAVIVLAVCLSLISLYIAVFRDPDLRFIPAVLCITGVISFVGPLRLTDVSYRSQTTRLNEILTSRNILKNGRVDTTKSGFFSKEEASSVWSILQYLHSFDDTSRIDRWVSSVASIRPTSLYPDSLINWLGIKEQSSADSIRLVAITADYLKSPVNRWINRGSIQEFNIELHSVFDTLHYYVSHYTHYTFYDEGAWQLVMPNDSSMSLHIVDPNGLRDTIDLGSDLTFDSQFSIRPRPRGEYMYTAEFPNRTVKIILNRLEGSLIHGRWNYANMDGLIIIERK